MQLENVYMDAQTTPETAVTVNQILDRYERDGMDDLAPRTHKDYSRHIVHIRREFGTRVAAELRQKDFGPFLNVKKGRIQRQRQVAVLSSAFTKAVRLWFLLDTNILRDIDRKRNKPRDRLVSQEEFDGVKAIASPRVGLAMMLAVLTGQRQGDIINFKWADIRDMELYVRQGKTGNRLAIEISKDMESVLDKCWLLMKGGAAGSPYVIPTRSGKPYTSEGFRACWQRTIKKWMRRGGENFHFHDLRALAATRCATPEIAMRLLGHRTISITLQVYRRGVERVPALSLTEDNHGKSPYNF